MIELIKCLECLNINTMNRDCQQIKTKKPTVSEWLTQNPDLKQVDLADLCGCDRRNVSQGKRLGHYVVINSSGKHFLIPATYIKAFS